jgi:hypothetical protein
MATRNFNEGAAGIPKASNEINGKECRKIPSLTLNQRGKERRAAELLLQGWYTDEYTDDSMLMSIFNTR